MLTLINNLSLIFTYTYLLVQIVISIFYLQSNQLFKIIKTNIYQLIQFSEKVRTAKFIYLDILNYFSYCSSFLPIVLNFQSKNKQVLAQVGFCVERKNINKIVDCPPGMNIDMSESHLWDVVFINPLLTRLNKKIISCTKNIQVQLHS